MMDTLKGITNFVVEVAAEGWKGYAWLNVQSPRLYVDLAFMMWICVQLANRRYSSPLYCLALWFVVFLIRFTICVMQQRIRRLTREE